MQHKQADNLVCESWFLRFGKKHLSLGENQVQTHFPLVLLAIYLRPRPSIGWLSRIPL